MSDLSKPALFRALATPQEREVARTESDAQTSPATPENHRNHHPQVDLPPLQAPLFKGADPRAERRARALAAQRAAPVQRCARAIDAQQGLAPELKAFAPRDFVLFGLPHHSPAGSTYTRRNGPFELKLIGDPDVGLPHGQDRLLVIFLATAYAALEMPTNNLVCFRKFGDVLELFGSAGSGRQYARVREWCSRWHRTTLISSKLGENYVEGDSYRLLRRYRLWSKDTAHPNQYTLFPNLLELDPVFADSLRKGILPIRLDLVRALKDKTNALSLALWQIYRSFLLAKDNCPKLELGVWGPGGVIDQLGFQFGRLDNARTALRRVHDVVKAHWPECPNSLSADGDTFTVRPAPMRPMVLPESLKRSLHRWEGAGSPFALPPPRDGVAEEGAEPRPC